MNNDAWANIGALIIILAVIAAIAWHEEIGSFIASELTTTTTVECTDEQVANKTTTTCTIK